MILVLDVADVNWNRPPGLGQDCMDFDTYMNQCSGLNRYRKAKHERETVVH